MDFKMKIYLLIVSLGCFGFGAVSGASMHTLIDYKVEYGALQASLPNMTLRQLTEISI
jgi:hypothetical protein